MAVFQVQMKQSDGSFKLVGDPTPEMREQVGICNVCGKEVYVRSGPQRTYWAHRSNETCEPRAGFVPMALPAGQYATNTGAVKNEDSRLEERPIEAEEHAADVKIPWVQIEEENRKEREEHRRKIAAAVSNLKGRDEEYRKSTDMSYRRYLEEVHTANDFDWTCPSSVPSVRLDLPWLTLWAISRKLVFGIPKGNYAVDALVRAELFLKPGYTQDDYDAEKASLAEVVESFELVKAPLYSVLLPHSGKRMRRALIQPDLTGAIPVLRFAKVEK